MPEIYKIGMTDRHPSSRIQEIGSATGVPTPFKLIFMQRCFDASVVEKNIHKLLAGSRVSNSREFFKATLDQILPAVSESCELDVCIACSKGTP